MDHASINSYNPLILSQCLPSARHHSFHPPTSCAPTIITIFIHHYHDTTVPCPMSGDCQNRRANSPTPGNTKKHLNLSARKLKPMPITRMRGITKGFSLSKCAGTRTLAIHSLFYFSQASFYILKNGNEHALFNLLPVHLFERDHYSVHDRTLYQ